MENATFTPSIPFSFGSPTIQNTFLTHQEIRMRVIEVFLKEVNPLNYSSSHFQDKLVRLFEHADLIVNYVMTGQSKPVTSIET